MALECSDGQFVLEQKGTLYHQDGNILGTAETVLFPQLAAKKTGVFYTIAQLAEQVGSTSWGQDIAWLDITAPETGLRVMNMVRNETRTLANMSLVAENALYNLPGSGETDEGFASSSIPPTSQFPSQAPFMHKTGKYWGHPMQYCLTA